MSRKITYTISEMVTYQRTIEIEDFESLDDDAIRDLIADDWVDAGHPINDFLAVNEREVDGWTVEP